MIYDSILTVVVHQSIVWRRRVSMESLAFGSEVENEVDIRKRTEQLHIGVEFFSLHTSSYDQCWTLVPTEGLSDLR